MAEEKIGTIKIWTFIVKQVYGMQVLQESKKITAKNANKKWKKNNKGGQNEGIHRTTPYVSQREWYRLMGSHQDTTRKRIS